MNANSNLDGPVQLNMFLEKMGVHPTTGWRWRKRGWLETVNICGIQYITPAAIADFNRRVGAGEFAKEPNCAYSAKR